MLQVYLALPPGRQEDRGAGEAAAAVSLQWSRPGEGGGGPVSR